MESTLLAHVRNEPGRALAWATRIELRSRLYAELRARVPANVAPREARRSAATRNKGSAAVGDRSFGPGLMRKNGCSMLVSKRCLCGSGRPWAAHQRPVRLVTGHPNSVEAPLPLLGEAERHPERSRTSSRAKSKDLSFPAMRSPIERPSHTVAGVVPPWPPLPKSPSP